MMFGANICRHVDKPVDIKSIYIDINVMTRQRAPSKATRQMLATLLKTPSGLHGYDITQATGIGPGTLYPMLARLEDRELLSSEWEAAKEQGRPPRKVYCLTKAGEAFAEGLLTEIARSKQEKVGDPKPA